MAYYRNSNNGYRVSGRDMHAYGYKNGAPWAEDRRALERAFYDIDRSNSNSESGWSSYRSAPDGRKTSSGSDESAVSAAGRHRKDSNEHNAQSLVDAMGLVRIGEGKRQHSGTGDGNGSYVRDRSSSSRTAGNWDHVKGSSSSDAYRNHAAPQEERYRRSHSGSSSGDYEGKGKNRATVSGNVTGRALTDSPSSWRPEYWYRSNYSRDSHAINEPFHERDTLDSRSSVAPTNYSTQWDQGYGYRGRMVSPSYGYDYDEGSEGGSSDYSYYSRTSGYDSCSDDELSDYYYYYESDSDYSA